MPAPPELVEPLLVLLRWLHALAAIGWLGWTGAVWLDGPPRGDGSLARQRFKEVLEVSLIVFLASGAVLTADRLSRGAGGAYAGLLALKVLAGALAFQYAFRWRRLGLPMGGFDGRMVLILGGLAVLLSAALKGVFDGGGGS